MFIEIFTLIYLCEKMGYCLKLRHVEQAPGRRMPRKWEGEEPWLIGNKIKLQGERPNQSKLSREEKHVRYLVQGIYHDLLEVGDKLVVLPQVVLGKVVGFIVYLHALVILIAESSGYFRKKKNNVVVWKELFA